MIARARLRARKDAHARTEHHLVSCEEERGDAEAGGHGVGGGGAWVHIEEERKRRRAPHGAARRLAEGETEAEDEPERRRQPHREEALHPRLRPPAAGASAFLVRACGCEPGNLRVGGRVRSKGVVQI